MAKPPRGNLVSFARFIWDEPNKMSSTIKSEIERKLTAAFSPQSLEVINESGRHKGHRRDNGEIYDGSGETHFRLKITSRSFDGMKLIDIHRAINHVLKRELDCGVHAMVIEAKAS